MLTGHDYGTGMFGPPLKTVFASRWRALWFAASVMLTTYCSIPDAAEPQTDDAASQAEVDNVMKALENSAANLKKLDNR
jgi:hypothetical protein